MFGFASMDILQAQPEWLVYMLIIFCLHPRFVLTLTVTYKGPTKNNYVYTYIYIYIIKPGKSLWYSFEWQHIPVYFAVNQKWIH